MGPVAQIVNVFFSDINPWFMWPIPDLIHAQTDIIWTAPQNGIQEELKNCMPEVTMTPIWLICCHFIYLLQGVWIKIANTIQIQKIHELDKAGVNKFTPNIICSKM
jgi:hypothetical protein